MKKRIVKKLFRQTYFYRGVYTLKKFIKQGKKQDKFFLKKFSKEKNDFKREIKKIESRF